MRRAGTGTGAGPGSAWDAGHAETQEIPVVVRRRRVRRRRPLRALVLSTLVLVGAAWLGSLAAVVATAHHDAATRADAIIVLGAAQYNGRPSPVLRARLDHAVALYHQGFAPRLIVTGGGQRGDRTTEAGVGRRYAVSRGVPDAAILIENEGRSTFASLKAAAAILHEVDRLEREGSGPERPGAGRGGAAAGVPAMPGEAPRTGLLGRVGRRRPAAGDGVVERSAILVSDPFHLLRLAVLARRFGVRPYPSAAPGSPIGASSRLAWEYYLRESLKVPFVLLTEKLDDE